MLFILQILHFYFFALLVLLFCPLRSIFMRFWALAHSSFNIFQKFQRIIKAGLNALQPTREGDNKNKLHPWNLFTGM